MAETGASKDDIDNIFGWLQAERTKDKQKPEKAYAGPAERSVRATHDDDI
jgi:hypothetical protein